MREFIAVTKALADENRVRIVMVLQCGELCACQIQALLQLAPSTVSKHLSILYQARLLEYRKSGRWMHYRLPDRQEAMYFFIAPTLTWLQQTLSDNPVIIEDRKRREKVCAIPRQDLCDFKNNLGS